MGARLAGCFALVAVLLPETVQAQGYRARFDLAGQVAAFRGVIFDSIPASAVHTDSLGSTTSADGSAVQCLGGTYCYLFRPGLEQRGGPLSLTTDVVAWGVGLPGLSLRLNARADQTLGDYDSWPGLPPVPAVELLEGYAEYAQGGVTAQLGRVQTFTRLGSLGFDGARVVGRLPDLGLELGAYGGYGLSRGVALPVNSPVLNPLDQYQPEDRELMGGITIAWSSPLAEVRGVYQRVVSGDTYVVSSERVGLDAVFRPPVRGLSLTGGADFDIAQEQWGSAEANATFTQGPVVVSAGVRRYRPFFDLWTIWGAFSPTPYTAVNGMLAVRLRPGLTLSARGESYSYDDPAADSPLVTVETSGWRWSTRAQIDLIHDVQLDLGYRAEFGPGASSNGVEGSATFLRGDRMTLTVHGAALDRPLEFRFDDASVWELGAQAAYRIAGQWSWSVDASRYAETRDRPDPEAFDWNQFRVSTRISVTVGSSADQERLPPAVRPGTGGGQ